MNGNLAAGTVIRIREGAALMIGAVRDSAFHAHHAVQVSLSLEDELSLEFPDGSLSTRFAIIPSGAAHRLSGSGRPQVLLLLEPDSAMGEALTAFVGDDPVRVRRLTAAETDALRAAIVDPAPSVCPAPSVDAAIAGIFSILGLECPAAREVDPRVLEALEIVKDSEGKRLRTSALAAMVNLSQSRLQHLFRAQVGVSLKRYLLWRRMIDAIDLLARGRDCTFGSVEAGFFELAHFSRSFASMFGMSPRRVFKDSASVQVIRE